MIEHRESFAIARQHHPQAHAQDRIGEETITAHLLAVLDTVDAERIRKCRFRVVLDSNHGAGSILGRRLLHELACRLTVLGEEPNGQFAHPPEPTAENLAGVLAAVTDAGADVGFCQDPDADRLAVIDQSGRYVGEEYTLAMCVDHVLRQRKGPIAANCASSRMSEDLAERYGVPYFRSAVGEANVVDAMLAHEAIFGGEGNGGPIDPRVGYVRDSFVGMALLLDAMAARRNDDRPIGRRVAALRNRQDEDFAFRRRSFRPPSMPWRSDFPTRRPIGSMACGSTGPAVGCWSAAATPSRSSGRLPRPRRPPRPPRCARPRRRCWPMRSPLSVRKTGWSEDRGRGRLSWFEPQLMAASAPTDLK